MAARRHPIFAYARLAEKADSKEASHHRDELLAGLSGRVIEIGAGTGSNFEHYPDTVTEVLAVEPEPHLRRLAERAAATARVDIRVVEGVADDLPAGDGEFDAGVASLVLCSVSDQTTTLCELHRVIRPRGELLFYEHVRSSKPGFARVQRALDIVWPLFGGGCHTSRDTTSAIAAAGFVIDHARPFSFRPCLAAAPASPTSSAPPTATDTVTSRSCPAVLTAPPSPRLMTRHGASPAAVLRGS